MKEIFFFKFGKSLIQLKKRRLIITVKPVLMFQGKCKFFNLLEFKELNICIFLCSRKNGFFMENEKLKT